jgi:predicted O-methyltransferase YrrM
VIQTFRTDDWNEYRMAYGDPHRAVEPPEQEIAVVQDALAALYEAGALPHTDYDRTKMLAHRKAVAEHFEIPWTAITPRMQRLLYAINAIVRPKTMIAAGVFCGNTFISNAGAAVGPGASYTAKNLIGIEIDVPGAELAERNTRRIDPTRVARVLAADALDVVVESQDPIDLLYLDADGDGRQGKGLYFEILEAAWPRLTPASVVLAHNSVNGGPIVQPYLEFVRDPAHFRVSVNVVLDIEGLEVSAGPLVNGA